MFEAVRRHSDTVDQRAVVVVRLGRELRIDSRSVESGQVAWGGRFAGCGRFGYERRGGSRYGGNCRRRVGVSRFSGVFRRFFRMRYEFRDEVDLPNQFN